MKQVKNNKIIRIVRPLCMILLLTVLLAYGTYSWIKRDWYPTLDGTDMEITTGGSLTFEFNNEPTSSLTVNELLEVDNFVLQSVSNLSGLSEHFFGVNNSSMGDKYVTFNKLERSDLGNNAPSDPENVYKALGKKFGYVDIRFKIKAPADNKNRLVYLHSDSGLLDFPDPTNMTEEQRRVASSLRVSITLVDESLGQDVGTTYIFGFYPDPEQGGKQTHTAINNSTTIDGSVSVYDMDNAPMYDTTQDELVRALYHNGQSITAVLPEPLKTFDNFDVDTGTGEPLFSLAPGVSQVVAVRIWLEGEDKYCTTDISGMDVPLLIKFADKIVD